MRFSKYEFYNKLLGGVTLLYIYTHVVSIFIYIYLQLFIKENTKDLKRVFKEKTCYVCNLFFFNEIQTTTSIEIYNLNVCELITKHSFKTFH